MSITIVLADDHPLTREGMKGYLSKEPDFEVVGEYADGESTWAGIKALRPQVALLDIRMPGLDGITIARMARDAGIQTAALMLTSYDANQYVLAALRAGARGYLLKTATMDTLSKAIRIAARGGANKLEAFRTRWIPMEKAYHAAFDVRNACRFAFDT